jgi:hypothetical protein
MVGKELRTALQANLGLVLHILAAAGDEQQNGQTCDYCGVPQVSLLRPGKPQTSEARRNPVKRIEAVHSHQYSTSTTETG